MRDSKSSTSGGKNKAERAKQREHELYRLGEEGRKREQKR